MQHKNKDKLQKNGNYAAENKLPFGAGVLTIL